MAPGRWLPDWLRVDMEALAQKFCRGIMHLCSELSAVVCFSLALCSHTGRRNGLPAGGVASRSGRGSAPGEKRDAAEDQEAVNHLGIAQIALRKRSSFSYEPACLCHADCRGDELSARDAHAGAWLHTVGKTKSGAATACGKKSSGPWVDATAPSLSAPPPPGTSR